MNSAQQPIDLSVSSGSLQLGEKAIRLEMDKPYEVWLPCDAPKAAKTLMQLLAAEKA